jgi:hypothetical protein
LGSGEGDGDKTTVDGDDAVFVEELEGWLVLSVFGRGVRVARADEDARMGEEEGPEFAEEALGDEMGRDFEEGVQETKRQPAAKSRLPTTNCWFK